MGCQERMTRCESVYNVSNTSCTGVIGADGGSSPRLGGSNSGTGACGRTKDDNECPRARAGSHQKRSSSSAPSRKSARIAFRMAIASAV